MSRVSSPRGRAEACERTRTAQGHAVSSHAGKARPEVPLFLQMTMSLAFSTFFFQEANNHSARETRLCTTINRHHGTMDSVKGEVDHIKWEEL